MNTGQTMLTILALGLLSLITLRYYSSVGQAGLTLTQSNSGLAATTVLTSFIERSQNMAFDAVTDTLAQNRVLANANLLTPAGALGPESGEIHYEDFNDFDDFNGLTVDYPVGEEIYRVKCAVNYVSLDNINVIVLNPTFLKRLDIKVWRSYPPADTNTTFTIDTVQMSTLFGYFKFNSM